jgi:hypothetical protein
MWARSLYRTCLSANHCKAFPSNQKPASAGFLLATENQLNINIMLTYKDFETRTEFVDHLGLYHNDRTRGDRDFFKIATIDPGRYQSELQEIHLNLKTIFSSWNNQSIEQIEKSVEKKGQRQLDIMQGQKQEKIRAGYHPSAAMYRIKNCVPDSYFSEFAKDIGLKYGLARYHVQFPGEVTAWHTDIFSPAHEFLVGGLDDIPDSEIGQDRNIRRILIALEEWDWGHILSFGKTPWVNWNAGDVIYWDYGVPHGGANMGYKPRISVSITGQITDKFLEICNHARQQ